MVTILGDCPLLIDGVLGYKIGAVGKLFSHIHIKQYSRIGVNRIMGVKEIFYLMGSDGKGLRFGARAVKYFIKGVLRGLGVTSFVVSDLSQTLSPLTYLGVPSLGIKVLGFLILGILGFLL